MTSPAGKPAGKLSEQGGIGGGGALCEGVAWLEEASRLQRSGTPFVLATVVAREAPQSARTGSKALVLPDGSLIGWVGGGCVRPTVLRESLAALRDGRPRLLRINPGAEPDARPDVRVYAMTCQGEGAVDVYLEPVLPRVDLVILGRTPVAEALARLARPLDIRVTLADPHLDPRRYPDVAAVLTGYPAAATRILPHSFVVVATMGEGDEEALRAALAADAAYVGLVASRKKVGALAAFLRESGVPPERIARVKAPAGLDFGAVTPAEIALSILAEIVQLHRASGKVSHEPMPPVEMPHSDEVAEEPGRAEDALTAVDPVCGMAVELRTARHSLEHEGRTYHFCCPHCKAAFAREPARYLTVASS